MKKAHKIHEHICNVKFHTE